MFAFGPPFAPAASPRVRCGDQRRKAGVQPIPAPDFPGWAHSGRFFFVLGYPMGWRRGSRLRVSRISFRQGEHLVSTQQYSVRTVHKPTRWRLRPSAHPPKPA